MFGAVNAWAEEGSKEFKKSFPAASINELTVTNRYGNIDVKQEGDEFSITTSVWVEAKTKAKVDEILEYISITGQGARGCVERGDVVPEGYEPAADVRGGDGER